MNKEELGQVFTPNKIVKKMIKLISIKDPKILEPSSGNGAFYYELIKNFNKIDCLEIDKEIAHKNSKIINFFQWNKKYDVIIGNPPYVEFKKIKDQTLLKSKSNLKHKPNLYMFFLEKSLKMLKKNGELIFVIPVEWLFNTSSENLNKYIFNNYTIQKFEILKENIWENASVTTAIFKFKKGKHPTMLKYHLTTNNKILFTVPPFSEKDIIVKVGAASGNNKLYKNNINSDEFFVDSTTERTGKKIMYEYHSSKNNWIRKLPKKPNYDNFIQIFVNAKTRKKDPFYILNDSFNYYDASVLCIYVSGGMAKAKIISKILNGIDWESTGIKRNGRLHLNQSLLKGIING